MASNFAVSSLAVAEEPFDAQRKRMMTFHTTPAGDVLVVAKGALEVLPGNGDLHRQADWYAERGYRVLVLAGGSFGDLDEAEAATPAHLTPYGLVAITDPPRPEVGEAIAAARTAGIRTVMITGDHPSTARAIAERLGLLDGGAVITGAELAAEDAHQLATHVDEIAVYARTTPEQKLAIVEALKAAGHVVAMTGDGVNDAPALRRADIGVAMGLSGTDVAKEAADMVLADDNFATIVAAAREGRRIYDNIRRFVRYGLTGGSAEIWVMLVGPMLGLPLPLLPVQILWVNLLTHGLPGLALGVERADPNGMRRPPRPQDENILGRGLWQHVVIFGALTATVTLGVAVFEYSHGGPWQTMLLTTLTALQLGNALAVRSETVSTFRSGNRDESLSHWSRRRHGGRAIRGHLLASSAAAPEHRGVGLRRSRAGRGGVDGHVRSDRARQARSATPSRGLGVRHIFTGSEEVPVEKAKEQTDGGVQTVLGLVEHDRARSVDHVGGDLFAAMCG